MSNLHVVYRVDDSGSAHEAWSAYSLPYSIYVGGTSLAEVRAEFHEIAESVPELDGTVVHEHIERPILHVPGAYVRVAIDRRTLDRDVARDRLVGSLAVRSQRDDFVRRTPVAATGDAVVIACVAGDHLSWVFEQMSEHDAVGLCMAGPTISTGGLTWWSFLIGPSGDRYDATGETESLGDAGLGGDSTVGDFMRVTSVATGRRLLAGST